MSAPALDPGLADDLRALRRDLHRHPELGLDNPRTQARILQELEGLGARCCCAAIWTPCR